MQSIDTLYQFAWLIPVLPLLGAAVVGMGLISYGDATSKLRQPSSIFIVSLTGAAMVLSFLLLWSQVQGHETFTQMFEWASAGDFRLEMGYTIDHLAALMLVVVTTVAFLVMIYTDGYMAHDPGYVRFYAYLSLFSSSMLGLVISPNLLQVYIFLGTGGDVFLPANWLLVRSQTRRRCQPESFCHQPRGRLRFAAGHAGHFLGHR